MIACTAGKAGSLGMNLTATSPPPYPPHLPIYPHLHPTSGSDEDEVFWTRPNLVALPAGARSGKAQLKPGSHVSRKAKQRTAGAKEKRREEPAATQTAAAAAQTATAAASNELVSDAKRVKQRSKPLPELGQRLGKSKVAKRQKRAAAEP